MAAAADSTPLPAGQALLTAADLNTTINHEPRVLDMLLAERLGFARPRTIKDLIERNVDELTTYGGVCRAARQTSIVGGRPAEDIYLNEGQALVICALSRTPKAAAVRMALIEVFMAWRRGQIEVTAKPVRVRPHRRALPTRHPDLEPGKFEPGSDLVLDMVSAVMSANLRVERGEARDFGSALLAVFEDIERRRRDPACVAGGQLLDHNHPRASQALAVKLRARGQETKPLMRPAVERRH